VKLVVDAVAVRPGSAAVVIGGVIAGWVAAAPEDEIVVLVDGHPDFPVPTRVTVESIAVPGASAPARLWAQSVGIRRACARHRPDALLSAITASAFLGGGCPSGAVVHDLRHELRPAQFTPLRRLGRRVLYGWTFRRADALFCNSARTRADLVARRPHLQAKAYVALLGADHAAGWHPSADRAREYVLAFGHFANKNVDRVLHAWKRYAATNDDGLTLRICGLSDAARAAAAKLVRELGVGDRVELLPWLSSEQFESVFAGAAAVLFPSDFEGFGLPAVEAMLLGVPVVVSEDPALLEVTGGHAVVAEGDSAEALAAALERALALTPAQLAAAAALARDFTWERCALVIREVMAGLAPHARALDEATAQ
jgi:glycosyltransferase involved in cell wall biosynthesis